MSWGIRRGPWSAVTIDVGEATVAGVPVTIGQGGVAVAGTQVPGVGQANEQADAALNAALGRAGVRVFTVAPTVTRSDHQETVDATGVHVTFAQPTTAPGVPSQTVEHVLGEVFADSLVAPGPAATPPPPAIAAPAIAAPSTSAANPPSSYFVPGTPGTPAAAGSSGPGTAGAALVTAVSQPRRAWLVLLYFLWQSTVLGAAASLWLWRAGDPT